MQLGTKEYIFKKEWKNELYI